MENSLFSDEELKPLKDDSPIINIRINQVPLFYSDEEKKEYVHCGRKLFNIHKVDNMSDLILKLLKDEKGKHYKQEIITKEEKNADTILAEKIDGEASIEVEGENVGG